MEEGRVFVTNTDSSRAESCQGGMQGLPSFSFFPLLLRHGRILQSVRGM